ncbi:MAG TPA: hypothetical protein VGL48_04570 [Acidimicrobiales bacterium]|jgi:heme-degrading monooxygenase HmoA
MSVVEITAFQLAEGADEVAFVASDRRVQTELVPNQPGFLRRTTARRGGDWMIVTLWWSEADAVAFEATAAGHPVQVEFEAHIKPGTIRSKRFDTLD